MCLMGITATAVEVTNIDWGHSPAIYENKVVWSDDIDNNNRTIHVYDLTTKKDAEISSYNSSRLVKSPNPAIYGNMLVWYDEINETPRLTLYDISSGAKSYITKNVDDNSVPAIYGNRVVWSANDSVYVRDISAHTQTMIAYGKTSTEELQDLGIW